MRAKEAMKEIAALLNTLPAYGWDNSMVVQEVQQLVVWKRGSVLTTQDPTVEGSAAFYKEGRDLLKADNDRLNAELAQLRLWKDAHVTPTREPEVTLEGNIWLNAENKKLEAGITARDLVIADLRKENTYLKECHVKAQVYFPSIDDLAKEQEVS